MQRKVVFARVRRAIRSSRETNAWEELRSSILEASPSVLKMPRASPPGANALRKGRVDSRGSRMKLPRGVSADRLIRVLNGLLHLITAADFANT